MHARQRRFAAGTEQGDGTEQGGQFLEPGDQPGVGLAAVETCCSPA
jgi:hypothetical protein